MIATIACHTNHVVLNVGSSFRFVFSLIFQLESMWINIFCWFCGNSKCTCRQNLPLVNHHPNPNLYPFAFRPSSNRPGQVHDFFDEFWMIFGENENRKCETRQFSFFKLISREIFRFRFVSVFGFWFSVFFWSEISIRKEFCTWKLYSNGLEFVVTKNIYETKSGEQNSIENWRKKNNSESFQRTSFDVDVVNDVKRNEYTTTKEKKKKEIVFGLAIVICVSFFVCFWVEST